MIRVEIRQGIGAQQVRRRLDLGHEVLERGELGCLRRALCR